MRYRLAVLTHGRSEPLEQTLRSFFEMVTPLPTSVRVYADGAGSPAVVLDAFAKSVSAGDMHYLESGTGSPLAAIYPFSLAVAHPSQQVGFCRATDALWQDAVGGDEDFVFWLEHDFVFTRWVDLSELALVLEEDRELAQVALVRGPANPKEIRAGGLVESRPDEFTRHRYEDGDDSSDSYSRTLEWLEHRSYFTTNPSLMRRAFMVENPWPVYPSECEGRYGLDLLARGFSFAAWGDGAPWVRHVGVRDGRGY